MGCWWRAGLWPAWNERLIRFAMFAFFGHELTKYELESGVREREYYITNRPRGNSLHFSKTSIELPIGFYLKLNTVEQIRKQFARKTSAKC